MFRKWLENIEEIPDYDGWITPVGKYLQHIGSHAFTLKSNNIDNSPDEAVELGFVHIWHNKKEQVLHFETREDKIEMIKKWVARWVNPRFIKEVEIEIFRNNKLLRKISYDL